MPEIKTDKKVSEKKIPKNIIEFIKNMFNDLFLKYFSIPKKCFVSILSLFC